VNGRPKYLSDPDNSAIKVLEYREYEKLSVPQVQAILRSQHIVINNFPQEQVVPTRGPIAFDEAGLRHLRNLESPIKFQGKSPCLFSSRLEGITTFQTNQSLSVTTTPCRSAQELWITYSQARETREELSSTLYRSDYLSGRSIKQRLAATWRLGPSWKDFHTVITKRSIPHLM